MTYGLMMRSIALSLMVAMAATSCYQYVPIEQGEPAPAPGAEVRARLSPPQSFDLGTLTVNEVTSIEGDVYRNDGDQLALWTQWLWTSLDVRVPANGSVFYLPLQEITTLEERRLQPAKSVLLIGGLVLAVVGVFTVAAGGGGGGGGGPNGPRVDVRSPLSLPLGNLIGR